MSGVRRTMVWLAAAAVVWLGLLITPTAAGSCAGPMLELAQDGAPITPRRIGTGENEKVVYDVDADRPLQIAGSNLTFDCQDTYAVRETALGCSGPTSTPTSEPSPTIEPMTGAELFLVQGSERWLLATFDDIAPDLTADLVVRVPAAARPGPAVLSLREADGDPWPVLDLAIR